MNKLKSPDSGFTIIEMLIAMAVFSSILMLIVTGYTQVMKVYQRGLAGRSTQQSARFIIDDISKTVRSASNIKATTSSGNAYLCLDNTRYVWLNGNQTLRKQTVETYNDCASATASSTESLVDASSDLAVRQFSATPFHPDTEGDFRSVEVNVLVATRVENALFSGDTCDGSQAGVEFCATAEISTIVSLRSGAGKQWTEFQN